jgi:hypothetical protein
VNPHRLSEIEVVDDVIPEAREGEDVESLQKDAKRANWQAIVLTIFLVRNPAILYE